MSIHSSSQDANSKILQDVIQNQDEVRGSSWKQTKDGVELSKGLSQATADKIIALINDKLHVEGFQGEGVVAEKKGGQYFVHVDRRLIPPAFGEGEHKKAAERIIVPLGREAELKEKVEITTEELATAERLLNEALKKPEEMQFLKLVSTKFQKILKEDSSYEIKFSDKSNEYLIYENRKLLDVRLANVNIKLILDNLDKRLLAKKAIGILGSYVTRKVFSLPDIETRKKLIENLNIKQILENTKAGSSSYEIEFTDDGKYKIFQSYVDETGEVTKEIGVLDDGDVELILGQQRY